jgi:ADP-heptose:LPS heptosyltransferase
MAVEHTSPRILILRRDNIGDLACTTPLVSALRGHLPGAWIGALVNTYNAEVLARNTMLDEVYVYEKMKHRRKGALALFKDRLKLISSLRGRKLDAVLVPAPSPQSLKLASRLGARSVLVSESESGHEVERSFETGRALGITGAPGKMRVFPDPAVVAKLREELGAGPFIALHISARRPKQQWPLYGELARELARDARVMLLWAPGPADDPRHPGDDAAAAAIAGSNILPVATPDLATLIAALSLARLVVCPDGGAMHLAAALGKPVVALFGDSPPERWRPWGVEHRVLRPDSRDLADLPLAPVLEAVRELCA